MNAKQEAWLAQARSDHELFNLLGERAIRDRVHPCHRLHYLQMCTEKLGKAYFQGTKSPPQLFSHVIFVKFLRKLSTQSYVRDGLGFTRQEDWDRHLRGLLEPAYEVERLAPDVAPGPNPEYPWPRQNPIIAPVAFDFPIWPRLQDDGRGRKLRDLIKQLLARFPEWF